MINGIYQIGKAARIGKKVPEIAVDIPSRKKDLKYKIGKINFNLDKDVIELDLDEEYEPGDEKRYKFINLRLTSTQNQPFATFTDLKRFTGEKKKDGSPKPYAIWISMENDLRDIYSSKEVSEGLKAQIERFLKQLKYIKENFYSNSLVDLSRIENLPDGLDFKKFVKSKISKKEEVIFWTIKVNGRYVVDKEFYDEILKKKLIYDKEIIGNVVCSLCGTEVNRYFDDLGMLPIKFFINDKIGFSQNLSNEWSGNFTLCENCYLSLFAGEKFVMNKLKGNVETVNFIVIPEFLDKLPVIPENLAEWSEYMQSSYNPFKLFGNASKVKNKLDDFRKYEGFYFLLNYIFYEKNNSQFKLLGFIKDVPNGRLDDLRNGFNKYKNRCSKLFPELLNNSRLNNFEDIYNIFPLRISKQGGKKKILGIPKVMDVFTSLLEATKIERDFLIHEFWLGSKAKYFGNQSYHNVSKFKSLEAYILQTHQLLILLKSLKLLNGGKAMEVTNVPEEFQSYIKEVGFDEKETSLFLLGTLIADIGSKQSKNHNGKKPILNKINFQGMSLERIKILFNEVYEKLVQQGILYPDEELTYGSAKRFFDKHIKDWNLKPYESVYYLLSGYAYKTQLNIHKAKESKTKKNKNTEVNNG